MGLRHLLVSPPHPRVSGLITRKDLITGAPGCSCICSEGQRSAWLLRASAVRGSACGGGTGSLPGACRVPGARHRRRVAAATRSLAHCGPLLLPPPAPADNAKLALGRKANLGLVDGVDVAALRRRLPFVAYAAYDPTAGTSRFGGEGSSSQLGDLAGGSPTAAAPLATPASPAGEGGEGGGDRYQRPLTQRRRAGESELAAVAGPDAA